MSPALERSVEKLIHNLQCRFLRNEAGRKRHHVAIVVLTAKMCYLGIPAQCTAYIRIFVHRHLHTVAAAANHNAAFILATIYSMSSQMSKIRIGVFSPPLSVQILHGRRL